MVFCSTVTHFLACNNLPQVQPFQLHALWHIFAGFGTYTLNLYWVLYLHLSAGSSTSPEG